MEKGTCEFHVRVCHDSQEVVILLEFLSGSSDSNRAFDANVANSWGFIGEEGLFSDTFSSSRIRNTNRLEEILDSYFI